MKLKKGFYIFLILAILLVTFVLTLILDKEETQKDFIDATEKTCYSNSDCITGDSCVLSYCDSGKCVERNVLLCYNDDGCCPNNCNSNNDNDC